MLTSFLFAFLTTLSVFNVVSSNSNRSIFILSGQSNMVGFGGFGKLPNGTYGWDGVVPPECSPNPLILKLNNNLTWEEATEPLHQAGIGPGIPFARSILDRNPASTGEIGLVPCAVGGTSIVQWARGSELYNAMLRRAQGAVSSGGVIRGLIWYQGETDTNYLEAANLYKDRFQRFLSDFRRDLMLPSLPVIEVAIISGNRLYIDIVRKAQIETATEVRNVTCVDAIGLQLGLDNIHLTTDAQVQLGKKLADAYLSFANVTSATNNIRN